ncbi:Bug family tripartite tricarboxylate transporter substrate binding protein [Tuberibacillus sp. Marseille-P3662]|uniref:Bug family tripartite tricarboxylate transporter substrate binding protein n=1 Tax=Tuberibacillus sp. Marseille-P3662 TaxID=1965358 RepID=UPI001594BE5D|nr:tripartite tricarboxylate transporter substrate binding protein [Tuberibacillus sp. Marseille-P3662]
MSECKRFTKTLFIVLILVIASACSATSEGASGNNKTSGNDGGESEYPTKDIKIIVHTSPGGPTDTMTRKLAKAAEPILGQDIVIENKPGGSGAAQMAALKSADSEGYTLASITPTHIGAWNNTLKEQFGPEDFSFVTRVQIDPYVLVVNADSEFKTLQDLVDYMKENPGETKVGGYGAVGSGHNVAYNIFAEAAGVEGEWVNYESTGDAVTALLGNHIDVANSNPGKVSQYVDSGKLRVLGVLGNKRLESMPDVPTYKEAGVPVKVEWSQFRGIYTNKDVPKEVLNTLSKAFKKAMHTESFEKYMKDAQKEYGDMDYKAFSQFIDKQMDVNQEWLEKLGIE